MNMMEIVEKLNTKEATTKSIAEEIGVNQSTVQRRLNKAGYIFNKETEVWELQTESGEPNEIVIASTSKMEKKKTMTNTSNHANVEANKNTTRKGNAMVSDIKALIQGTNKDTPKKVYKGLYLDPDIALFLDNVQHGNKSEIVNRILRQYLTENELM